MMRGLQIVVVAGFALLFQAAVEGSTCYEQAPFDCPEDNFCTSWNDGCNECGCENADSVAFFCTLKFCPCLEDNTCVPFCKDNDACVPSSSSSSSEPLPTSENGSTNNTDADTVVIADTDADTDADGGPASPFVCPEGTFCTEWTDGCNNCAGSPGSTVAACTEMYCPCYDDNSCVPVCKDNDQCVPAATANQSAGGDDAAAVTADENSTSGTGSVQFWLPTTVFVLLTFGGGRGWL